MPKLKLSFDEVIAKGDNIIAITGKIKDVVQVAKAARADGEVTDEEILSIKEAAQAIVDEAQALADEVIEDLLD